MNITDIRFHQRVKTPDGNGVVHGRLTMVAEDGSKTVTILCSHSKKNNPRMLGKIKGIWWLGSYPAEELEEI